MCGVPFHSYEGYVARLIAKGYKVAICEQMEDPSKASLARHRSGIYNIKTLKNREYAARGFGFVYSETDDDFDRMPYTLKVPADESPVSIPALIEFCQHMTVTPREIRDSIRHLSWEEQMKKVYEQIVRIKK